MAAYYNEFDPGAAEWLRELIKAGLIAPGEVDERSITDVRGSDLRGFDQCHFFAGIGGWSYALRLAGWADSLPVWTGSCPCPPFSSAGKRKACPECQAQNPIPHPGRTGVFACCECGHEWLADERHLWPEFHRLIADAKPPVVFGEQVAGADGLVWLAGVRATLEGIGYAVGSADLCVAGVGAPHIRQRLYWVADASCMLEPLCTNNPRGIQSPMDRLPEPRNSHMSEVWETSRWALREPEPCALVDGFPERVGLLRGYGNAIVPQVAEAFIRAAREAITTT